MLNLKTFMVNDFGVNSFVLSDESNDCILIDAGYYSKNEFALLYSYITSKNLKPVKLVCTHCHVDHILGNYEIIEKFNIPLATHKADDQLLKNSKELGNFFGFDSKSSPAPNQYLDEGDILQFGNSQLEVIHVPGHSPGSLAFYNSKSNFVIVGDVLFKNSIGRTDLPGGDYNTLIHNIKSKLLSLPPETVVYPGHGPTTTIKDEYDTNPFLQ